MPNDKEIELPPLDMTEEDYRAGEEFAIEWAADGKTTLREIAHAARTRKRERQLKEALAEVERLKERLNSRDRLMHGKFGFVPSPDNPKKCGCAYCTQDYEALADHAAEMEMLLYLPRGWKDRAEKAEAELNQLKQQSVDLKG